MNEKFDLSKFDNFAKETDKKDLKNLAEVLVTQSQMSMIYSLFGQVDLDKSDFGIEKISHLTRQQASDLIEQLLDIRENIDDEDILDYYNEIGEDLDF